MWHTTVALQVVTYNEKLPQMSGAVRGEVKRARITRQKNQENRCIQTWTSDVTTWEFLVTLKKRVLLNTLTPPLLCSHDRSPRAELTAAPRAPVGEALKPERRWCHGPDVKKARWPVARLLFPPSTITHRANRGCTHRPRGSAAKVLRGCPDTGFIQGNY